jgi:hypothetical protein
MMLFSATASLNAMVRVREAAGLSAIVAFAAAAITYSATGVPPSADQDIRFPATPDISPMAFDLCWTLAAGGLCVRVS